MSSASISAEQTSAPLPSIIDDQDKPPIAGWTIAAICVVALHAVIAYFILREREADAPGIPEPPAVMVDLAPLSAAPPVQEDLDLPPEKEKMEEQPDPEVKPPDPDVKPPDPTPQVQVETPQDVVIPESPLAPKPEVVLETQKPPPPPQKPDPEKKKVEKVVKKEHKPKAAKTAAPKRMDAAPSQETTAASTETGRPSISPANWQSQVSARLNSVKHCPGGSGSGTATVAFSISGGGGVGGGRLVRSSGNGALDEEAVSMVHRAAPYPPTPSGGTVSLTVPIHFGCGG